MSRKHIVGSVHRRGQQNEVFATLVGLTKRFEAYSSQFFDNIDRYVVYLQVDQMPRSQDLAIFVLTTDNNRQNRLLYPLRMHAGVMR